MTSREEAIAYFQARGFRAEKRDWAMGQTVLVLAGRDDSIKEIECWNRAVYLCPDDNFWIVSRPDGKPDEHVPTLDGACKLAEDLLGSP